MNAVVVYESMWGNTARLAQAIAKGLGDVPVLDVARTSANEVDGADLLVIGGPTHALSMSRLTTRTDAHRQGAGHGPSGRGIREFIRELPPVLHPRAATFDSRVGSMRHLPGSAARSAARELRRHHDAIVVDSMSFYVHDTSGPLEAGELARAVAWGEELGLLLEPAGDLASG